MELLRAFYEGREDDAVDIIFTINFEYEMLWNIIDSKSQEILSKNQEILSVIDLCCAEITRLDRENKRLKKQIGDNL